MNVLDSILAEAAADRLLWLAAGVLLAWLLVRVAASSERARFRSVLVLAGLAAAAVVAAGVLRATASPAYPTARFAALGLALLAAVAAAGTLLFAVLLPRLRLPVPRILHDVIVAAASIAALFVLASRFGFDVGSLFTASALLTAVIGLASQDTLGNVLAGLALQLDHSVELDDWIKIGDVTGKVSEIRWRYTAIETRNWETVIVPNSVLMKGQVTVLGRRGGQPPLLRRWIYFHVDFRFHPTEVMRVVTEAVTAAPIAGVAASPEPNCVVMEFGESLARYALRYWLTDLAVDDPTDSRVRTRVYFALHRASIPMSMPALHVFATEESHQREVEKSAAELEQRRRALAGVDFFDRLPEGDVAELARGLRPAPFASGEVMTRQGAEAHWLYIIVSGEARVSVAVAGGLEQEVRRVGPGSFFGEMSLMTGEPRQATVVALTDVVCYRLDREAFRDILQRRPEQAAYVAGVLARRRVELVAVREDLDHEAQRRRMAMEETHLLERIRHFFGLGEGHPPGSPSAT